MSFRQVRPADAGVEMGGEGRDLLGVAMVAVDFVACALAQVAGDLRERRVGVREPLTLVREDGRTGLEQATEQVELGRQVLSLVDDQGQSGNRGLDPDDDPAVLPPGPAVLG
ncbi:hypothetical protein ACFRCI_44465 [Streptomyces sp. NPDC056638]|uniref:hypothetical protein n=1 Tax=Streptomyces sp. NPDC056638 TaxID=3345887 RepID=UPI003689ED1C